MPKTASLDGPEIQAWIAEFWRLGYSRGQIARELGVSLWRVRSFVEHHRDLCPARATEVAMGLQTWPPERVALLTRLYCEGRPASQIASELGPGFTRNMVIGKTQRLGLSRDDASPPTPAAAAPGKRSRPRAEQHLEAQTPVPPIAPPVPAPVPPPPAAPAPIVLPPARPVFDNPVAQAIKDLRRTTCRWPIGDPLQPEDFRFCGAHVAQEGKPYCSACAGLAYQASARTLRPSTRTGALHGRA